MKLSPPTPAAETLRKIGLKVTPARLSILELFAQNTDPLTAHDVFVALKGFGLDQATVYRNLNSLKEKDVIRQVGLEHDHAHYELTPENEHHHVICVSCGRVEDFVGCIDETVIQNAVKQTKNFDTIDRHSFELFGRCKQCAQ